MNPLNRKRLKAQWLLALAAVSAPAWAADGAASGAAREGAAFQARAAQAKTLENTAEGKAYTRAWYARAGEAIAQDYRACHRLGGIDQVTVVAEVAPDGQLPRVQARPLIAPIAQCIAQRMSGYVLPAPPIHPAPYPIEIDFTWTG